jgi:hypothetical protein
MQRRIDTLDRTFFFSERTHVIGINDVRGAPGIPVSLFGRPDKFVAKQTRATTMSGHSDPVQPDDLSSWCKSVETFEPGFESQVRYIMKLKDKACVPRDFEPAIVSFFSLSYCAVGDFAHRSTTCISRT